MRHIRMLTDADGSPDGHTVHRYEAGAVYNAESLPALSDYLLEAFLGSQRAVETDADGNPLASPADKRETKPTGPSAKKAATQPDPTPDPTPAVEAQASGTAEAPTAKE